MNCDFITIKEYLRIRKEDWGGLILDQRYDRIWGFSKRNFELINRIINTDKFFQGNYTSSKEKNLESVLKYLSPHYEKKLDPFQYNDSFFLGPFPKHKDFRLKAPISLSWAITNKCNSSCIFCCTESQKKVHFELNKNEIKQLIANLAQWGVLRIIIGGGEPLIRSDINDILYTLVSYKIFPTIATNLILLNQSHLDCIKNTCSTVQVSLDTVNQAKYKYLRGINALSVVKKNIKKLHDTSVNIRIVTVLNSYNEAELEEIAAYLKSIGITQWFVFIVLPAGRAADRFEELKIKNIETIKNRLIKIAVKYRDMSIWLWGTEKTDSLAIYLNCDGSLELFDYNTNLSVKLPFTSIDGVEQLKSAWKQVTSFAQMDTLVNFTTPNRC